MKRIWNLLRNNRFVENTNWLIFQNIYSMMLSLVVGALSARYLGPSNYGLIGYGTSLVNLFTSISQLGLDSILMNEMVCHPEKKGTIMGTALCMRLVASTISFGCVLILVAVLEPGNYVLWIITALQAFSIACKTYELLNEWFLAELKSKYYVLANICGQTVVAVWKLILLVLGASVLWFGASTSIQVLVCGSIVGVIFLKSKNFSLSFSFDTARELFDKGKHYVIAGLAIALYTQMDKVMLGKLMGETEVGLYTSAMTIAMLWEFIPQAIINSSRVLILEKKTHDEKAYREKLELLLFAISGMGLCVGIVVQVLGKLAIYILYGKEYMSAVPVLQLLIWSTSFAMIGVARNIWSVAENKNRYSKNYTICGGIFNLIFNAITIPIWGMGGAALGTLGAQVVVALISPLFWKETRPFVGIYLHSWKTGGKLIKNLIKRS